MPEHLNLVVSYSVSLCSPYYLLSYFITVSMMLLLRCCCVAFTFTVHVLCCKV